MAVIAAIEWIRTQQVSVVELALMWIHKVSHLGTNEDHVYYLLRVAQRPLWTVTGSSFRLKEVGHTYWSVHQVQAFPRSVDSEGVLR